MIGLLKLQWKFIKNPDLIVKKVIPTWSLNLGIGLYILYLYSVLFQNPKTITIFSDILVVLFGVSGFTILFAFWTFNIMYLVLTHYYFLPIIVRKFLFNGDEVFQINLFRKILFYSYSAIVIFTFLIIIPLQILSSLFLLIGTLSFIGLILGLLKTILGLWFLLLTINLFVIQWKGLKNHFNLSGIKIFLALFIIPFMFFIPFLLVYGGAYLSFIQRYMQ